MSLSPPTDTQDIPVSLPALETTHPDTADIRARRLAWQDVKEGLHKWPVWLLLAWPFWITLSMAITVFTMGYLYSHLFHTDINVYLPHLATGMLIWTLNLSLITELTDTFAMAGGL